jgi:hypothetical protein
MNSKLDKKESQPSVKTQRVISRSATIKAGLLALLMIMGGVTGGWSADLVWLCPSRTAGNDFYNLFTNSYSSQWSTARSRVNVFKFYIGTIQGTSDAQLQAMFAYLRSNNIAMGLEWPPLSDPNVTNLEGFQPAGLATNICARIQRLGGQIDYVGMDEPLYYGHYYAGGPQYSVHQVARNAAVSLKQIQQTFPNVIIGDIEPIDAMPIADWQAATGLWLSSYNTAMGQPLAFFHVDCMWGNVWPTNIPLLFNLLAPWPTKLGVIFNTLTATSDATWMESAEVHIQSYNDSGIVQPNHILFQNWLTYPTTILPETNASSYTYLPNYYAFDTMRYSRLVKGGFYFYTADATELNQFLAAGWKIEKTSDSIYTAIGGTPSLSAFYRVQKMLTGGSTNYFYTANTTELYNATNSAGYGYSNSVVVGYVLTGTNGATAAPLYRAYSSTYGHFYTTSLAEYNGLATNIWIPNGICCYLPASYAVQVPPQGFSRLVKGGFHFYTANPVELNQFLTNGWTSEGTSGRVYTETGGAPLLSPFYRAHAVSGSGTLYFYTVNTTELTNALTMGGYTYDGIAGNVFTGVSSGGVPLYRAYSVFYGYFYTTSLTEYNGLPASTWAPQGISCYLP